MAILHPRMRPATADDAPRLAPLVNDAAEGMPLCLWAELAETGENAWEAGMRRICSEDASISYRNTWIAEVRGDLAGCVIAYSLHNQLEPIPDNTPGLLRPLLELEHLAPGTGYVYVLSTLPKMRGKGVGSSMLRFAERYKGPQGMSLVVSDANVGARRLYERLGFRAVSSRPMVKGRWQNPGSEWVLMIKPRDPP